MILKWIVRTPASSMELCWRMPQTIIHREATDSGWVQVLVIKRKILSPEKKGVLTTGLGATGKVIRIQEISEVDEISEFMHVFMHGN